MTMKTCTTSNIPFALVVNIVFFFLLLLIISSAATPGSAAISGDIHFIQDTCNHLQYVDPTNCYKWFSGLAGELDQSIIRLVQAALQLNLNQTVTARNLISTYYRSHHNAIDKRAAGALHDCGQNLDDSVDLIRSSIQQGNELYQSTDSSDFQFKISNIQTWLSATETDQSTCTDGFDEIERSNAAEAVLALSSTVKDWLWPVGNVTELTLALVNSIHV